MIIKIATTNNKINDEDDTLHTLTDSAYIYSFMQYALHAYICYSIFQIAQSTESHFYIIKHTWMRYQRTASMIQRGKRETNIKKGKKN